LAGQSDDGFFALGPGGELTFSQALFPFTHRSVAGLEADHSPGQFNQRSAQARVTVFGHAALHSSVATAVFAGTEPGVTGDLPAIVKAVPVADLPIE
jgi:hypothetical protein